MTLLTPPELREIRERDADELARYNRNAQLQKMPPIEHWSVPASLDRRKLLAHVEEMEQREQETVRQLAEMTARAVNAERLAPAAEKGECAKWHGSATALPDGVTEITYPCGCIWRAGNTYYNNVLLNAQQPSRGEASPGERFLDALHWAAIKQAAKESAWMPPQYIENDWVSDVCEYLRNGRPEGEGVVVPAHIEEIAANEYLAPSVYRAALRQLISALTEGRGRG